MRVARPGRGARLAATAVAVLGMAIFALGAAQMAAETAAPNAPPGQEKSMKKDRATPAVATGGLATMLIPSPASPLVTFRIQFRAGAIDDPAGKEGLNALTALTIAQGGTKELTYREVTERLDPMAASIQGQPEREVTTFVGEVHRDHLKGFYELFTSILLKPRFDPADFARGRDLLLAEIETNLRGNDDEELGKETLNLMMYGGGPYGRPDIGTVQGLKSITLDDVKTHYLKMYRRGNVLLGVAGGYPPAMIETLKEDFAALPEGAPAVVTLPMPRAAEGMEVTIVDKPAPATAISIGFPIDVTRADKDYTALVVAASCLGEHRTFNGRLMNSMRADRGLNYGDYAYIETFIQDGGSTFPLANIPRRRQHFSIWIRPVRPENTLFALRQATRELARLVSAGLPAQEFEQTRKYLLNYSRLWTQSMSRRLGYQMDARFYGTPDVVARLAQELPKLKLEDVNAAVKKHLGKGPLSVAIVTDKAADLKALLLSGKPTPISYQTPTTREDLLKEDKEIEAYPLPVAPDRVRVVKAQELFER